MTLTLHHFDYQLPRELIAQNPADERDASRLLVLDRASSELRDDVFRNLPQYLNVGDVIVANRSRVIPARISAVKPTGGRVEIFLLRPDPPNRWLVLARPSSKLRSGAILSIPGHDLQVSLEDRLPQGQWKARFEGHGDIEGRLRQAGTVPLPPYITNSTAPPDRYQTVYGDTEGSVAAPTAGLHFTPELLEGIQAAGIGVEYVTLHVGLGTFKPVSSDRIDQHHMHPEWGEIQADVAERITEARRQGHRIIAIGTTTVRLLETATADGMTAAFQGETDRFIYPGYRFSAIDGLVTNFHLPRSTLLMLVSAFAGREFVLHAYQEAIARKYRFYSFGDAMLVL